MFEDRNFEVTTVSIDTPDDDKGLRFARMTGFDSISECYSFQLVLHSADFNVNSEDLLGTPVTVRAGDKEDIRHFHGLVDQFRFAGLHDGWGQYELTLRPALWFLSKTSDNRIFQAKSVVEIIEEVLGEQAGLVFETRLNESYDPRDYCVQYGETDLDFIQRLMEFEGIYYFHEFADGEHKLILVDDIATLEPAADWDLIDFENDASKLIDDPQFITKWDRVESVVPGAFAHTDYDFIKPSADLTAVDTLPVGHAQDDKEKYAYPGPYTEHSVGTALATVRLQEGLSPAQRIIANSTVRMPFSGCRFALGKYPRDAENTEYCILRADYDLVSTDYSTHAGVAVNTGFSATYLLMPGDIQYRPPRKTPKSVMKGPQTAVVVGPGGEEIHTDEYSRVKVQFHWDRLGGNDENSSCWVRVSSVWAGSGWGFIQIPRIGQEVIVDFLEGDPDQPIITGRVYNAEQMPPYGLPDNATQSGWKSNSSLGGGGWNELRFEDKAGSEEVYFQAQKDHNELVKNNETRTIGNDWVEDVGHDATQSVGNNRSESVGVDKDTTVGSNRVVNIGVDDTESVGANRSLSVGANETISVGANSTETIGVNHTQTVGAVQTITVGAARIDSVGAVETRSVGLAQTNTIGATRDVSVGAAQSHSIGASDSWTIGAGQTVSVGAAQSFTIATDGSYSIGGAHSLSVAKASSTSVGEDMDVTVGKNLTITAADSITLKCGKASIILKKDGTITIDGKDIAQKASGKIDHKASGDITQKGAKIKQN